MRTVALITAVFAEVDAQRGALPTQPEAHRWPSAVVTVGLWHARTGVGHRTSYHLSTPICQIFTPSTRPAHDESGWHHSTCDDATWPSGYAAVDRQYCVRPGHAAVPSPATPHTRC
jgi:hypothetical protein